MILRRKSLSHVSTLLRWSLALGLTLIAACRANVDTDSETLEVIPGIADEDRGAGSFPIWAYDGGPDPTTPMGKELIDLNADIPYFPGISDSIYGAQMFRPAFGPIPWRMMQEPNSVKILFIGQDGTHIAEAAGRPATAGFGGRAQDLAQYFGVSSGAAFINTYAFTIRWQYGAFDTPMISKFSAVPQYSVSAFTGNPVWLITQDQDSPVTRWRNQLIDWIIRNNKDSLKMIVLFGGAARDAAGAYIESKGGTVGTRRTTDLTKVTIPEFFLTSAGSNRQTAVPYTSSGTDLYKEFNGTSPAYTDPNAVKKLQTDFIAKFKQDPDTWWKKLVVKNAGLTGSGMVHPAQLGGYDIAEKLEINGVKTISLKGLKISNDLTIDHDVLLTQLPHPTALSTMTGPAASQAVGDGLKGFAPFVANGWVINADPGFTNEFALNKPYKYARGDMGPEYYDFGAPNSRMVNVSSASRSSANVIVFGTRDRVGFDQNKIKAMTNAKPSKTQSADDMWIARPRATANRYTFDPGPGEKMAKLMKQKLPKDTAFVNKHKVNGDYGHYRGSFKDPQVIIIADPDGYDDLLTARALTGERGQYLNGLMDDIGVGEKYLVLKTAPYAMDEGDPAGWQEIVTATNSYREALIKETLANSTPKIIFTDGPTATTEFARIVPNAPCPVIEIKRQTDKKDAGIKEALPAIQAVSGFQTATATGKILDITRSHLTYYARVWEGTSGDRVITSNQAQYRNKAFALVAPRWAYSQNYTMPTPTTDGIAKLKAKLDQGKLRYGEESIPTYLNRNP